MDSLQKETSIELKKALDITSRTTTTTPTTTTIRRRNTPSRGRRLFVLQLFLDTLELVVLATTSWISRTTNVHWLTEGISWVAKPPAGCKLTDYLNYTPTGIRLM